MNDEKIKAWVTRYALTSGIQFVDAVVCHSVSSNMIIYGKMVSAHGKDWHRTPRAAVERAEEMRKQKIISLNKSIKKLESLTFMVPNK